MIHNTKKPMKPVFHRLRALSLRLALPLAVATFTSAQEQCYDQWDKVLQEGGLWGVSWFEKEENGILYEHWWEWNATYNYSECKSGTKFRTFSDTATVYKIYVSHKKKNTATEQEFHLDAQELELTSLECDPEPCKKTVPGPSE